MTKVSHRVAPARELADELISIYTTELLLREEIVLLELELDEIRAVLREIELRRQLQLKSDDIAPEGIIN
jgi:hypothetical protein